MTFAEELEAMRAALVPEDRNKLVHLQMDNGYFRAEVTEAALTEYAKVALRCLVTGEKATVLEQLAIHLLRDSAGLP